MADKWRERRLPDEETAMILVRLPADDLARYKLVCKGWRSLISSPDFVSAHLNRSKSDPSSHQILVHDEIERPDGSRRPGPFKSVICCSSPATIIVGSINGLSCMVGNYRDRMTSPYDIWILNPVTGHARKLPLSTTSHNDVLTGKVSFAFWWDSDSITDGYKVVKIFSKSDDATTRAEVWDSSSDTWSQITVDFHRPFYLPPPAWVTACDIVVEGFAYWIVVDFDGGDLFVVSLDMTTLVLKPISLPELSMPTDRLIGDLKDIDNSLIFGANWKGNFALVERVFDSQTMLYNMWTMDASGAWSKNFSFDVDFDFQKCINSINGKLVLECYDSQITLYDMETQKYEVLGDSKSGDILMASAHDSVGSSTPIEGFKPLEDLDDMETQKDEVLGDSEFGGIIVASAHDSVRSSASIKWIEPLEDLYDMEMKKDEVLRDNEFCHIFVASAHDFVGSLVSIEGFKPLEDYDTRPGFTVIWPGPYPAASGRGENRKTNEGITELAEAEIPASVWLYD